MRKRDGMRRLALGLLAAALVAGVARAQQAPGTDWNPQPAAGDLVLPLPCEQGLVFRRVLTPVSDNPLADRQAILGDEEADSPFFEFVREAHVAGSFGSGAQTHFWMGKYEVTVAQYLSVMQGCDTLAALPQARRRLPQTSLSWTDAMRFADAVTRHVLGHAAASMPAERNVHGFVRLPTEAEWEFTARGGAVVSDAEFRARLPPLPGSITDYAQLRRSGTRATPVAVGLLQPDRLGLFDMLGNAEEMVMDPFRLTRGGRSGGRVGGIVARGGDINVAADRIRTSQRLERAPYRQDGSAISLPGLGFRVAIGLQVAVDDASVAQLRRGWEQDANQREGAAPVSDPRLLVQRLEQAAVDPAQRRALAALRSAVEAERTARTEADERAARSAIGAGAAVIRALRNSQRVALGQRSQLPALEQAARGQPAGSEPMRDLQSLRGRIDLWERVRDQDFSVLASLVLQQIELPQPLIEAQLAVWRQETEGQADIATLHRFAGLFVAEVAAARRGRAVQRNDALRRVTGDVRP